MRLISLLAAATVVIGLPGMAVAAPASLTVRDPVIHPGPQGGTTAAYMTLVNPSDRPLKVTGVECSCAEMAMFHRSSESGGVAHMSPAGEVVVPPRGNVVLAPGGLHLMVMGLKQGLRPGASAELVLQIDHLKPVTITVPVKR